MDPASIWKMAGADIAAALRHGHGDDGALLCDAGTLHWNSPAVDGGGSGSGKDLDGYRRSGATRVGAQREVLRKPAGGVRDPDAAQGMDRGAARRHQSPGRQSE